jgi:hypothetical protein
MGQTSVDFEPARAIEGMVSRTTAHATNSRCTTVDVQNGRLVVQGTRDGQCRLPTGAGDLAKPLGVAPYRATQMPNWPPSATPVHYQVGQCIEAVSRGRVWVKVEEAVVAHDPVFVRHTVNGGLDQLGAFRKSADGGNATLLAAAKYLTTAASGALALVELNLP